MEHKKSKKSGILLGGLVMSLMLCSIFLSILAFQDIPKYNSPYIFTGVVSGMGMFIGNFVWKKMKSFILKYSLENTNNETMSTLVIATIIGTFLFAINEINIAIAQKTNCNLFYIKDKYRKEGGFRRVEVNRLVVDLFDRQETVICEHNLWLSKEVGDEINLCFYESFLGFNYIEINE